MTMPQLPTWVKRFGRNFYAATLALFFVWMVFFDSNDFITQFKYWRRLQLAKEEKEYYQEKIKQVMVEREELINNNSQLEKFAREKYLMKKPTEDLYLVVEED